MRIEAYTQVQQLYNSSKVQKDMNVQKKAATDKVSISTMGMSIQAATQAVKSASDIRYDVCDPLKKAVANGTYDVDSETFAEKLLKKYQEMN